MTHANVDQLKELGNAVSAGMERITGRITAEDVFGPVVEIGDRTVLTAAAVERAGGMGLGGGSGESTERQEIGGGGGGGGGGTAAGRPVAVIDVGPHGVVVRPVIDFTRVGIAVVAALLALWKAGRRYR